MSQHISTKDAERRVFTASFNDGLLDIFLGCFISLFAIAPILSTFMGDFWSSAIFLPFWGIVYVIIRLLKRYVVTPRMGMVKFGDSRKRKLARLSVILFGINIIAFVFGIIVATNTGNVSGQIYIISIGTFMVLGFSFTASFLGIKRLYLYGLLIGLSPVVGEWLFSNLGVSHHGFPVTFGLTSGIMIVFGLIVFIRLVHTNPLPTETDTMELPQSG